MPKTRVATPTGMLIVKIQRHEAQVTRVPPMIGAVAGAMSHRHGDEPGHLHPALGGVGPVQHRHADRDHHPAAGSLPAPA